ncbi:MAG TPA: amidohydrolase family protein [Devosiaceae bacterium]|nr:amidohydrolase family protein [Devosiaceae bacterium]
MTDIHEPPLVDCHFHLWRRDHPTTDTAWYQPPTDAALEDLLALHDQHGIALGVVAAASVHGEYIDYVRAALKAHRRLRATAILPPNADPYRMQRMQEDGFVGVRLMWSQSDTIPDTRTGDWRMFLRRVADMGWHVHLVDRPERFAETIAVVEAAGPRLVIDHMGDLRSAEGLDHPAFKAILAAVERGNTWVKMSGRFRNVTPEVGNAYAHQLLSAGGTDRVLWASDWPFSAWEGRVTFEQVLKEYYEMVPDAAMRRAIDRTALKFYFG